MNSKDLVACTLCSGNSRPIARKGGYQYWCCDECAFIFLCPMPSFAELAAFYNTHYRSATPSYYPKARSRGWRALLKSLRFLPYAAGKRALDIGCGGGFMAHALSRLGCHATGLDISEDSIRYARRRFPHVDFYCESFGEFASRGLEFEFVFSSELLEHVPSPWPFMELVEAVSVDGTHVYISTPDAGHASIPHHFPDWSDLTPPEHVQFFNQNNLVRMFSDHGFRMKRAWVKKSPAHSILFVRSGRATCRQRAKTG